MGQPCRLQAVRKTERGRLAGPSAGGAERRRCAIRRWEKPWQTPPTAAPFYRTRTLSGRIMRRPLIILAAVALAAVLVVGILQSGGSDDDGTSGSAPSIAEMQR